MTTEDDYARTYSEMEDEELREIARDASDLVPVAKGALDKELAKRGVEAEVTQREPAEAAEVSEMPYCPNCNREVEDPLTCNECSSVICPKCGTALRWREDMEDDQAASASIP